MRKSRKIVFAVGTAMALTLAGCGSDKKAEEVVPTVAPTATPTIPPVTATPAPTSTPAPRKIGEKTSQSKFVYLTNNLKTDVRELYLMVSGSEDWGDNLIPREFSVKASDQVQMFYTPESVQASAEEEDSEEEASGYLENGGEPTSEIEAAARDMSAPLQNNTGRPDALDRLVQSLEENPEPEDDV